MEKVKLEINDKLYDISVARSKEEMAAGLSQVKELSADEGMIFVFEDGDAPRQFTMEHTSVPLDIIFVSDDLEVLGVASGKPGSQELIEGIGSYVLEVPAGSGIEVGDEIDIYEDDVDGQEMHVLDESGGSQMTLQGSERVMSQKDTRQLIKLSKKAEQSKKESDYRSLGKTMFRFLDTQDSNKTEYVEVPQSE